MKIDRGFPILAKILSPNIQWLPIEQAPRDNTVLLVYAPGVEGLPDLFGFVQYHPDAGYCIDELRNVKWFIPVPEQYAKELLEIYGPK